MKKTAPAINAPARSIPMATPATAPPASPSLLPFDVALRLLGDDEIVGKDGCPTREVGCGVETR